MNTLWLCSVKHRWKRFNGSDNPRIRCRRCLRCDAEHYMMQPRYSVGVRMIKRLFALLEYT